MYSLHDERFDREWAAAQKKKHDDEKAREAKRKATQDAAKIAANAEEKAATASGSVPPHAKHIDVGNNVAAAAVTFDSGMKSINRLAAEAQVYSKQQAEFLASDGKVKPNAAYAAKERELASLFSAEPMLKTNAEALAKQKQIMSDMLVGAADKAVAELLASNDEYKKKSKSKATDVEEKQNKEKATSDALLELMRKAKLDDEKRGANLSPSHDFSAYTERNEQIAKLEKAMTEKQVEWAEARREASKTALDKQAEAWGDYANNINSLTIKWANNTMGGLENIMDGRTKKKNIGKTFRQGSAGILTDVSHAALQRATGGLVTGATGLLGGLLGGSTKKADGTAGSPWWVTAFSYETILA